MSFSLIKAVLSRIALILGFSIHSIFMRTVDSLELAEDVCVLRWDAAGLEHRDTEGKDAAHLQLARQTLTTAQLGVSHVTQLEIWRKQQGKVREGLVLRLIENAAPVLCNLHMNSKLCTIQPD